MPDNINLTPKELLFIAANLGATEFMGIPDAFFGMEEDDMQQEASAIQSSLEEKGYAEMDFDGDFALLDSISEAVNICANCDVFIAVDVNIVGQVPQRHLYYEKSGSIIKITEDANGYFLSPLDTSKQLAADILQNSTIQMPNSSLLKDASLSNATLIAIKSSKGDAGNIDTLIKNGCDETSAKAIISGLAEEADYFSITAIVYSGTTEGVYSLMLSIHENGMYSLEPVPSTLDEGDGNVMFKSITAGTARLVISNVIRCAFPEVAYE